MLSSNVFCAGVCRLKLFHKRNCSGQGSTRILVGQSQRANILNQTDACVSNMYYFRTEDGSK